MSIYFDSEGIKRYVRHSVGEFISGIAEVTNTSRDELSVLIGEGSWNSFRNRRDDVSEQEIWPLKIFAYNNKLFDLFPKHGIPSCAFNIFKDESTEDLLTSRPLGGEIEPPPLPLLSRPTYIAGHRVEFPIGLPASILATNSDYLRFFADRGFCILTYKTVRSRKRAPNPWPQWVFAEGRDQLIPPLKLPTRDRYKVSGIKEFIPDRADHASMVNSFGVPSHSPDWWMADVRRARDFIEPGNQVLIVSVVATDSDQSSLEDMADDFAQTARAAIEAGADIVELNFSCPNTPENHSGDLYEDPNAASVVTKVVREALGPTSSILVKIGYLSETLLRKFVEKCGPYIDGITAINTLSVAVEMSSGDKVGGMDHAGLSGWAIQRAAQEVAINLSRIRKDFAARTGKWLTILGVGGVMSEGDFNARLGSGVDAVQTCTAAFLNPEFALELRFDKKAWASTIYKEDAKGIAPPVHRRVPAAKNERQPSIGTRGVKKESSMWTDQKYVPTQPPGGIDIEDVANQWEKLLTEESDEELFQRLIDATEKFGERHPNVPAPRAVPQEWKKLLNHIKKGKKT